MYFKKINKPLLIDNYDNYYFFVYNGQTLNKFKEKTIKEMNIMDREFISVLEINK